MRINGRRSRLQINQNRFLALDWCKGIIDPFEGSQQIIGIGLACFQIHYGGIFDGLEHLLPIACEVLEDFHRSAVSGYGKKVLGPHMRLDKPLSGIARVLYKIRFDRADVEDNQHGFATMGRVFLKKVRSQRRSSGFRIHLIDAENFLFFPVFIKLEIFLFEITDRVSLFVHEPSTTIVVKSTSTRTLNELLGSPWVIGLLQGVLVLILVL